jgi:hypothetical protein
MVYSLKPRNCLSKKTTRVLLPITHINHQNISKSNRIRLSMDMDLAVAKLNLAELRCQEEES